MDQRPPPPCSACGGSTGQHCICPPARWCRDCDQLTSGDCGKHGPRIIVIPATVIPSILGAALLLLASCTAAEPAPPPTLDAATLSDAAPVASVPDANETLDGATLDAPMACHTQKDCRDGPGANAVCCEGICLRPGDCPDSPP